MAPLVKVVTLGCPKNSVDSDQMMGYLHRKGYSSTVNPAEADIILINTCGFVEDAKRESIETILEFAQWKEKGNCKFLIVAGCLVQKYSEELAREIPEVDLYLGTGDIPSLPELLTSLENGKQCIKVGDPTNFLFDDEVPRIPGTIKHYAYIKIAEGCSNRCSYCVIPSLRGDYRSRKIESIVREVSQVVDQGVREIILVAQDTTLYGVDLYGTYKLVELLRELVKIPELSWVRLLYCYPSHITDELLEVIRQEKKICSYLDIPLQHIADDVLKNMGRPMTALETAALIKRIRDHIPDIILRSTFIVGFPGEREEDFAELLAFLEETKFDRAGFFPYSPEPDTRAALMPHQVGKRSKARRLEAAIKLQEKVMAANHAALIGSELTVMVDGPSLDYEGLWEGRTQGDAPEIDGVVYFSPGEAIKPGRVIRLRITHSQDFALMGDVLT